MSDIELHSATFAVYCEMKAEGELTPDEARKMELSFIEWERLLRNGFPYSHETYSAVSESCRELLAMGVEQPDVG